MGIQGLIGPQVDAKIIHMGGGQEVSRGREGEAGGGGINQEAVYQSAMTAKTMYVHV